MDSILKTEDRDLFSREMTVIGQQTPTSRSANNVQEALNVAEEIGYPVLVRAAFALGGLRSHRRACAVGAGKTDVARPCV